MKHNGETAHILEDKKTSCKYQQYFKIQVRKRRLLFGDFLGLVYKNLILLRTKKTLCSKIFGLTLDS